MNFNTNSEDSRSGFTHRNASCPGGQTTARSNSDKENPADTTYTEISSRRVQPFKSRQRHSSPLTLHNYTENYPLETFKQPTSGSKGLLPSRPSASDGGATSTLLLTAPPSNSRSTLPEKRSAEAAEQDEPSYPSKRARLEELKVPFVFIHELKLPDDNADVARQIFRGRLEDEDGQMWGCTQATTTANTGSTEREGMKESASTSSASAVDRHFGLPWDDGFPESTPSVPLDCDIWPLFHWKDEMSNWFGDLPREADAQGGDESTGRSSHKSGGFIRATIGDLLKDDDYVEALDATAADETNGGSWLTPVKPRALPAPRPPSPPHPTLASTPNEPKAPPKRPSQQSKASHGIMGAGVARPSQSGAGTGTVYSDVVIKHIEGFIDAKEWNRALRLFPAQERFLLVEGEAAVQRHILDNKLFLQPLKSGGPRRQLYVCQGTACWTRVGEQKQGTPSQFTLTYDKKTCDSPFNTLCNYQKHVYVHHLGKVLGGG